MGRHIIKTITKAKGEVFVRFSRVFAFFILLAVSTGCSNEQTFEQFFHKAMKENEKDYREDVDYSYSLVHQEQGLVQEDDAIAIFKEHNLQGE